jgi:hypothetical protein
MSNDNQQTYKVYNLQKYFMEVKLYNPDTPAGKEFILNPEAIIQLVIEDELHFWPIRGFFIYENPYEGFERKMASNSDLDKSELDANIRAKLKEFQPYVFRNDGKDFLEITIRPVLEDGKDLPIKSLPSDTWEMKYKCVIYDKEDIPVSNITQKMKKYYFWDADYQKMLDNTIQWSTATSTLNPAKLPESQISQATDDQRKMPTGLAIQSILEDNGFLVDKNNFNTGSTKIFYTSLEEKNIWDNIEYILDQHFSTQAATNNPTNINDLCIFDKDRSTNKFELRPVNEIFKKAGNQSSQPGIYQIEHLFFDETGDINANTPYKAPFLDKRDTAIDVKIAKIKEYQFVDMCANDNTTNFVTTPVHSYDFKNKTFAIHVSNSHIDLLAEKMKQIYIDNNLLTVHGSHPLITLNKDKKNNKRINPVYSIRSDLAAINRKGMGRLLESSLFLNQCLVFQVDGATLRRSGRFIGIDRQTFSDNTFDYKLCGQWFVTKVTHNFFQNMYNNEVTAIKMHSYENLNIKQDI